MQVPPFWHGLDWQSSTSGGREKGGEKARGVSQIRHTHTHFPNGYFLNYLLVSEQTPERSKLLERLEVFLRKL